MRTFLFLVILLWEGMALRAAESTISLAGRWRFRLDREDAGVRERWFETRLPGTVRLPGGLTEQGIGDRIGVGTKWTGGIVDRSWFTAPEYARYREAGKVKVPFWLQPELSYVGAAWFQREVRVPREWEGRSGTLFLERPHWETRVWVDGRAMGTNQSLGTPHAYPLGVLSAGAHVVTLRVDNRMVVDVGENPHSVSDHTQGNWNGVVGRVELRATGLVWIEELQVYPRWAAKSVTVRGRLAAVGGRPPSGRVTLSLHGPDGREVVSTAAATVAGSDRFEAELELGAGAEGWDEFHPALYELAARVEPERGAASVRRVRFGLRDLATEGTRFTLNGRSILFRGTLECAIFPRTGHPPTDVASWRRIYGIAKAHGLNLLRFHSWCPPEAAFEAADEAGFYLQVECSSWANQSTTLGDGKPVDAWVYAEADRILREYGNHPSFLLFLYGNEPGGNRHREYLSRWVSHFRALDPRRLVSGGAGWPQLPEDQFHVAPEPRIQGWGAGLKSRINGQPPETVTDYRAYIGARRVPVISHEIGEWCVYPNFAEMRKYDGYLKPRNFEIFRDRLEAAGMGKLAGAFLHASGRLQTLCYKEEIESVLRTPGMGGFELLDLHDFPGQGTALVGVLDPFWEGKGYVGAREFRRFAGATVPLARLERRVFTTAERLIVPIEMAHFGAAPLTNAVGEWRLVGDRGRVLARGEWPEQTVPVGSAFSMGSVDLALAGLPAPARYGLVVGVRGTEFENDWDVWVYSAPGAASKAQGEGGGTVVRIRSEFGAEEESEVRAGGNVLLTIPGARVRNHETAPVKLGFSSIFWNTAWTGRQAPTTLGILCDPAHPALAGFPTETHANWQWWYLIHRAGALRLDLLPRGVEPIVRVIDDWVTARPLGLVVEGRMGRGRIVICGFDLTGDPADPVSSQMRTSLLRYLGSGGDRGRSLVEFTPEQVRGLWADP